MSVVKGVMLSTTVSEAAGIVDDFITVYREGESEVPLSFNIEVDLGSGVAVKGIQFLSILQLSCNMDTVAF